MKLLDISVDNPLGYGFYNNLANQAKVGCPENCRVIS